MTTQTLRQFIGHVKQGLARTSHYNVSFKRPTVVDENLFNQTAVEKILLFCEQTQLPGMNIQTSPVRTYGETIEMPNDRMFDPVTFTFYVDKEMKVKIFFDQWISNIQNGQSRQFNFYKDYVVDVAVEVYDVAENSRYKVELKEAYPKTISSVEMNYGGKDVMRVQVTMAYRYWTTSQMTNEVNSSGLKQPTGLGALIAKGMEVPNKLWNAYNTGDWQNTLKSMDLPTLF